MTICTLLLLVSLGASPLDWRDIDNDGLNGRQQAIAERCAGGLCLDQYSGRVIPEADVDVDHVLPRKRAEEIYENGLAEWRAFVNWQPGLVITSKKTNRSKGARGPEQFCPELVSARPWYADRYELVAKHFNLALTDSERAALSELRAGRCAR